MTRIIGGTAGGRRLRTPPGSATRPTTDRVREALFSMVESALGSLAGVRFLDLYAGSGAVGLEAASRGAVEVTLVEQDRRTAGIARGNARSLGLDAVEVVCASVTRHLQGERGSAAPYDVVFLDPPYAVADEVVVRALTLLVTEGWLADPAAVVVERGRRSPEPAWPPGLVSAGDRSYGTTHLYFAETPEDGR